MPTPKPTSIDEYIADFPKETQEILKSIRRTIRSSVPDAVETISYGMPSFKLNSTSVWFAAYKKHIGLYPMYGMDRFKEEMEMYRGKGTKDTLQFPYDKPLPLDLISKWVKYKFYKT